MLLLTFINRVAQYKENMSLQGFNWKSCDKNKITNNQYFPTPAFLLITQMCTLLFINFISSH